MKSTDSCKITRIYWFHAVYVARVHVMSALIRTAWDHKVTISFAFTYLELVKHRLFGIVCIIILQLIAVVKV